MDAAACNGAEAVFLYSILPRRRLIVAVLEIDFGFDLTSAWEMCGRGRQEPLRWTSFCLSARAPLDCSIKPCRSGRAARLVLVLQEFVSKNNKYRREIDPWMLPV